MQQVLKRLEQIKTSILLEDTEIIEFQVLKLGAMTIDEEVKAVLTQLDNSDYGAAVHAIELYQAKYAGVVVYEDKELQGLKLELKVLENKFQMFSEQKNEYTNEVNDFNTQYNLQLGSIIKTILDLKQKISQKLMQESLDVFEAMKNKYLKASAEYKAIRAQVNLLEEELEKLDVFDEAYDELYEKLQYLKQKLSQKEDEVNAFRNEAKEAKQKLEDDPAHKEYKENKQDYEEFSRDYKEVIKEERCEIDEEGKKELKKLFRKAAKLCHPDIVSEEHKEKADEIMKELNSAYGKYDIDRVREILHALESGLSFAVSSDVVDDKDLLKRLIDDLREKIIQEQQDIQAIQDDETFKKLNEIDDWDEYFELLKTQLEEEETRLKSELHDSVTPQKVVSDRNEESKTDDYWDEVF